MIYAVYTNYSNYKYTGPCDHWLNVNAWKEKNKINQNVLICKLYISIDIYMKNSMQIKIRGQLYTANRSCQQRFIAVTWFI